MKPSSASTPGPEPIAATASGNANRGWVRTRRITAGILLAAISLPFVGAAGIWLASQRASSIQTATGILQEFLEPEEPHKDSGGTQVEVRVGWLPLLLGRWAITLAPVPPEIRTAFRSVREAEVRVWNDDRPRSIAPPWGDLHRLDDAMKEQHWNRLVSVQESGQQVVVYLHEFSASDSEVSVCIGVVEPGTRVVVGGRIHADALADLVRQQQEAHGFSRLPWSPLRQTPRVASSALPATNQGAGSVSEAAP